MAHPRSMKVKEVKCEGLQATVVQRAAENNFKGVFFFAIINCSETASLAREVFKTKIATECRNYAKQRNSLNTTAPALVAEFRNSTFVKEVEIKTPFLYSALQGGVKEDTDFNKIADIVGKLSFYHILLVTNPTRLSSVAVLRYISSVHPLNNRYWENFREHFLSLLPNSRPPFLFTHLDTARHHHVVLIDQSA